MSLVFTRLRRAFGQRGVALLAGLVLLTALSLLGVIAAASMLSQQRMAGNHDDGAAARANADIAVTAGLTLLLQLPDDFRRSNCTESCFTPPADSLVHSPGELPALPEFEPAGWWAEHGLLPGTAADTSAPPQAVESPWAEAPRFTLEELAFRGPGDLETDPSAPPIDGIGYYRVLGRGAGRQPGIVTVAEAIVARPWRAPAAEPARDWRHFCSTWAQWYDCGGLALRLRR